MSGRLESIDWVLLVDLRPSLDNGEVLFLNRFYDRDFVCLVLRLAPMKTEVWLVDFSGSVIG